MTLTPLVVLGAGGHAREVIDIVEAMNRERPVYELLGLLDDDDRIDRTALDRRGFHVLGRIDELRSIDAQYVIGIGTGAARQRIDERIASFGRVPAVLIHPSATVGADSPPGPGLVVAAGARITTNVMTGRHVHVNLNATVAHDAVLGDFVSVYPGANVSGGVRLGAGVTIGAGACVIQGIEIGARTMVGAGAVVIGDLAAEGTAVGVPARLLRNEQP